VRNEESGGIYEELIVVCLEENISIRKNEHKHRENIREDQEKTDTCIDNVIQYLSQEVGKLHGNNVCK
jgi:hypothetical protein